MKMIVPVLTLLPILTACKKDPPIPFCEEFPDECVDIRKVKDYFYFNIGSYWVYEEENSGMRDSVFVTESSSSPETYIFSTKVTSSYDGYNYRFWANSASNGNGIMVKKSERSTQVIKSKSRPGEFVDEETCFIFYPTVGAWVYTSYISGAGTENFHTGKLEVESILNNLSVGGQTYSDVVKIHEDFTSTEEGQTTKHYYVQNIGLIKKQLLDSNQIWNLIDYHIVN